MADAGCWMLDTLNDVAWRDGPVFIGGKKRQRGMFEPIPQKTDKPGRTNSHIGIDCGPARRICPMPCVHHRNHALSIVLPPSLNSNSQKSHLQVADHKKRPITKSVLLRPRKCISHVLNNIT